MKKKSFGKDRCPIARSVDAIGDCWSLLIVRDSMIGTRRFSAFQKNLGVAKNILAVRLRALVAQGVLEEQPASDGSAYQEYVLTPKGRALFPIMVALRQWGEEFSFKPNEDYTVLLDRKTSQPLGKLEVRAQDGRVLRQADTMVVTVPALA